MRVSSEPKFRMVGARVSEREYRLLAAHVQRTGETAAEFLRRAILTGCGAQPMPEAKPDTGPETARELDARLDPPA